MRCFVCLFLSLASLTGYNHFKVEPCCSIYPHLLSFCGRIIFHCVTMPQVVIQSSLHGPLGCLHLFVTINNAAMNFHVQVFV